MHVDAVHPLPPHHRPDRLEELLVALLRGDLLLLGDAKRMRAGCEHTQAEGCDSLAEQLDYVPMPDGVVKLFQANWKSQLKDPGGKPIY